MATPGIKSMRGRPEAFDEPKIPTCLSLTQTAREWLHTTAKGINTSKSDLIEQMARGGIYVSFTESDEVSKRQINSESLKS